MRNFSLLVLICVFMTLTSRGQDSLMVSGNVSSSQTGIVAYELVRVTYYDGQTILNQDTVYSDTAGDYSSLYVNSNTDSVVVELNKCNTTSNLYPKGLPVSPWTGLQVLTVDFTNYCASNDFSFVKNGNNVTFAARTNAGRNPYTHSWDFGDGNGGSGINPSHTYASNGTYNVRLTSTDSAGDTCVTEKTISLLCSAAFTVNPNKNVVSFVNQSVYNGNLNYDWDFGDGNTSTDINPTNVYLANNTYDVKLVIKSDSLDCVDSVTQQVSVDSLNPTYRLIAGLVHYGVANNECEISCYYRNEFTGEFALWDRQVTSNGFYSFEVQSNDVYYLWAEPAWPYTNWKHVQPDYYDAAPTWEEATAIVMFSENSLNNNFTLTTSMGSGGTASISGNVTRQSTLETVENANILLFQGSQFILRDKTDFNGAYELDQLLPGTYELIFDYIGYRSQRQIITIDQSGQQLTDIDFVLYDQLLQSSPEELQERELKLYPNPAFDRLWLEGELSSNAVIEIHNIAGKKIGNTALRIYGQKASIDVSQLNAGYYVITIRDQDMAQSIPFFKMN